MNRAGACQESLSSSIPSPPDGTGDAPKRRVNPDRQTCEKQTDAAHSPEVRGGVRKKKRVSRQEDRNQNSGDPSVPPPRCHLPATVK